MNNDDEDVFRDAADKRLIFGGGDIYSRHLGISPKAAVLYTALEQRVTQSGFEVKGVKIRFEYVVADQGYLRWALAPIGMKRVRELMQELRRAGLFIPRRWDARQAPVIAGWDFLECGLLFYERGDADRYIEAEISGAKPQRESPRTAFEIFYEDEMKRKQRVKDLMDELNAGHMVNLRALPSSTPEGQGVYVLKAPAGVYKIGRTVSLKRRLSEFSVLPFDVEVECFIQTYRSEQIEKELHRKFKDKRIKGEWFKLDESDIEYIKSQHKDEFR